METLPGVAPQEQQNTYFYVGQHETKRTVPVTTELGNQAQDAGVSLNLFDTACSQERESTDSLPNDFHFRTGITKMWSEWMSF